MHMVILILHGTASHLCSFSSSLCAPDVGNRCLCAQQVCVHMYMSCMYISCVCVFFITSVALVFAFQRLKKVAVHAYTCTFLVSIRLSSLWTGPTTVVIGSLHNARSTMIQKPWVLSKSTYFGLCKQVVTQLLIWAAVTITREASDNTLFVAAYDTFN